MSHLEQAYAPDIAIRMADEKLPRAGIEMAVEEVSCDGTVYERDGLRVIAFEVDHGELIKPAYGYRIEYGGRSVTLSGDTRYNENVIRYGAGVDLLIHEVAIARPELAAEPYIQRILAHHTSALDVGRVFAQTRPKLAAYTHLVFLSNPRIPTASVADLIAETRCSYVGPLVVGRDLMCFDIAEQISIR